MAQEEAFIMKRQLKTLLIAVGAVALLVGAVLLLQIIANHKRENEDNSSTETQQYTVIEESYSGINRIDVKNENDEYTILRVETDEFSIAEFEGYPQSKSNYTLVAGGLASFISEDIVKSPQDLSIYGLEVPKATVKAYFDNGKEYTVYVGAAAEYSSSKGYYAMLEGNSDVYVLDSSTAELLICPKINYISLVLSNSSSENLIEEVESAQFSGTATIPFSLRKEKLTYDGTNYSDSLKLNVPYDIYVNEDKAEAVLSSMFNTFAGGVVKLGPTDEELEKYGFNNPSVSLSIKYGDDETLQMMLGGKDGNGNYYIMNNEYDVVYLISEGNVSNWSQIKPADIMASTPVMPSIYLVKEMLISYGGETYNFKITSDPADTSYISIKLNGEAVDTDNFKKFYAKAISYVATDTTLESVTTEKELEITYVYKDSASESETVAFYSIGARKYQVVKNGKSSFITNYNGVKDIEEALGKLLAGESIA